MVRSSSKHRRTPLPRERSGRTSGTATRAVSLRVQQSPNSWFWVGISALALALRVALIPMSLKMMYPGDHDDFVRWGIQATDRGILSLYSEPPARHTIQVWQDNTWVEGQRPFDRICNYPPLSAYLFWVSGTVHKAVAPGRLINTTASHAIYSFWSLVGDFLVAAGSAAIVALFHPGWRAALTYALVLLLPPLWWDSMIWGQTDSILLAPAVWMLYFMLRQRWLIAGILWGIALGLKTQGILFAPLWGLALFIGQPRWSTWAGLILSGVTLSLIALPFTLTGGWSMQGPDWFRLSYSENLFSTYAHLTTLKSFNIWYLDLLLSDSLDARNTWLGIEKNTWGHIFLASGLVAAFIVALRRWRGDRRVFIFYSTAMLLLFMMLPTSVHERYLILVLPFLGVASAVSGRLLGALALMVVVFMGQVTWPLWLGYPRWERGMGKEFEAYAEMQYAALAKAAEDPSVRIPPRSSWLQHAQSQYRETRDRTAGWEWLLTILALGGTFLTLSGLVALRPQVDPAGKRTSKPAA